MVYVVIPNYNGLRHLRDCFDSLVKQSCKEFKVVLVDNNSSDESIAFTNRYYPGVIVIKLDKNTGFAKAVNEGIKFALKDINTKYVILLNNDVECDENFISELVKGVEENDCSSCASKMLNFYDRTKIDDTGDFIKKKGSPFARGHSEKDKGQYNTPEYIFGPCAGAAIYKREVFPTVGFFDEDFFAYYEDIDFSFRMQLYGLKCYYNPKAICYHKRGATTKDKIGFETELCEKNLIALRIKNYPLLMLLKYELFFFFARFRRYYYFYRDFSFQVFKSAVKGYFRGLLEIPISLSKRSEIQRSKSVSNYYIENLFR